MSLSQDLSYLMGVVVVTSEFAGMYSSLVDACKSAERCTSCLDPLPV